MNTNNILIKAKRFNIKAIFFIFVELIGVGASLFLIKSSQNYQSKAANNFCNLINLSRYIPISSEGNIQWDLASDWLVQDSSSLPGLDNIQGFDHVVVPGTNNLIQTLVRNNLRYSRNIPIATNGTLNWAAAGTWNDVTSQYGNIPGTGDTQAQTSIYTKNNQLTQFVVKNNIVYERTVPVINSSPDWTNTSSWIVSNNFGALPGFGTVTRVWGFPNTDSKYVQYMKQGAQLWARLIFILETGDIVWPSSSPWTEIPDNNIYPGIGNVIAFSSAATTKLMFYQFYWKDGCISPTATPRPLCSCSCYGKTQNQCTSPCVWSCKTIPTIPATPTPTSLPIPTPTRIPTPMPTITPSANLYTPVGSNDTYVNNKDCTVRGWTCDKDAYNRPLSVHIYSGSKFLAGTIANLTREAAVGTICGGYSTHGFSLKLNLAPGTYPITIYSINIAQNGGLSGTNPALKSSYNGTTTVTIQCL